MKEHLDLKREWEKTKKQLQKFSQEAIVLAKKGEDEIVKFSHKGKLQLDSTAIGLKIEHLYYLVGKEYFRSRELQGPSSELKRLVGQIKKLEKEQRSVKVKIRRAGIISKNKS